MIVRALADSVAASYRKFRSRRLVPIFFLAVVVGLCTVAFFGVPRREDVSALLPDGPGAAAEQFRLLQRAPFSRKLTIHLRAGPEVSEAESASRLVEAADRLSDKLKPPLFSRVVSGPDASAGPALIPAMLQALPRLSTEEDLKEIEARIAPDSVQRRIRSTYLSFLSPEGMAMKTILREDPLGFREFALKKLRHVNVLGNMRLVSGHFVSKDGRSALMFAETPIALTDTEGAEKLVAAFDEAARDLPPGVSAKLIGAHRYTLANAQTIKRDLSVILTVSSVAMLILFAFCMRGWGAVWVLLLPFGGIAVAGTAVGAGFGKINGITVGFGAVLLGIAVEYGIQVYYAFLAGKDYPDRTLQRLTTPMLFAMLTTVAGFAVLFGSELPVQRELALFSIAGLVFCYFAALFVLPHLFGKPRELKPWGGFLSLSFTGRPRRWVVPVWCLCLAFLGWQATGVRFSGDLKRLGVTPPELQAAERELSEAWGDVRSRALFFAEGADEDQALAANAKLFGALRARLPDVEVLSLAPLLPSMADQEESLRRWRAFWTPERLSSLEKQIANAAQPLGFSPAAFTPFLQGLTTDAPPVGPGMLQEAGLGDLVGTLLLAEEGRYGAITLAPDSEAVRAFWRENQADFPMVRLVSPSHLTKLLGDAIRTDFSRFMLIGTLVVTLLTALLLRAPRATAIALTPPVAGLVALFGVSAMMGLEFDLFNIVGAIFLSGVTVDYGIFMVCRDDSGDDDYTDRALILSALSTLAGVGALILARHPALFSLGLTVFVGVAASLPTALWVVPALKNWNAK